MPRTLNSEDITEKKESTNIIPDSEYAKTIPCNKIGVTEPFKWLSMAIHDLIKTPLISLFYGLCFTAAAIGIVGLVYWQGTHLVVLPSLIVYMLIGPFLALGLYDAAWELEKGHKPKLLHSMKTIRRNSVSQWGFALILCITMIFWMRIAALLHVLYPSVEGAPIADFLPFLIVGSLVGFALSIIVFCISVFSMPMMMERQVDIMSAVFTSFNAVKSNLSAMIVWAAIICTGLLIGFATFGLGMIVVMPILGYGTWHGYEATIQRHNH